MIRTLLNVWLALFIVVFILIGGVMTFANFTNDNPTQIREAVLGVGLLIAGILLMGIQIITGLLNEILEHTKQGSEASKEVAVRLRNRNGSGR